LKERLGPFKVDRVLLYLIALVCLANTGAARYVMQAKESEAEKSGRQNMGVNVSVLLFDLREYEQSILPAYQAFMQSSDTRPLIGLLQSLLLEVRSGKRASYWSMEVYQEELDILTGKRFYSSQGKEQQEGSVTSPDDLRRFVEGNVAPDLVRVFCIPHEPNFKSEQSMSLTALDNYLYSQSSWIEDYFTGSREVSGPMPEIKLGEWSRFFTREEIETFDAELSRMTRPVDERVLNDGFDNLRTIVHTATINPKFKLLFMVT
jgi:hypothetical protein